jgi:hypothetical protein
MLSLKDINSKGGLRDGGKTGWGNKRIAQTRKET